MAIDGRWRAGIAATALGIAALAAWYPASGQQRPESILPPGFGQPAAPAPPRAAPSPRATTGAAQPRSGASAPAAVPTPSAATAVVQPLPGASGSATATPTPTPTPTIDAATLARYEMPLAARRSLTLVGPASERDTGFTPAAFGNASGPMLETMMRRLAVPLPSRWLSIALRRLLLAPLATPAGVGGADFAAERAWLLLRMGEADGARAVVQGVDNANYTAKLLEVAMNAMLANGDPAGLCPLVDRGRLTTGERGWVMAQAMCAALAGAPGRANPLIAAAKRHHVASGIDLALAQKVVGAGPNGGRAVTIEWAGVDRLTIWRFGLALATGVAVPDPLLATAGPQVTGWRATAPQVPLVDRIAPAEVAAGQGVLSSAALVDLYGAVAALDEPPAAAGAVADDLRNAYTAATADDRLSALHSLWGGDTAHPAYARLVLTARAAARIAPASGNKDADRLVAAMLSAGLDRTASRWKNSVEAGSDAWAMIALADPDASRLSYRDLASYSGSGDAALKQRLFFAGLAGLGRLAPEDIERSAQALDVRIGAENAWTRALDRAARDGQPGTVVLLAALGMQTPGWKGVPPAMLYRIVGALRAVGLGGEARMISAEAIARA